VAAAGEIYKVKIRRAGACFQHPILMVGGHASILTGLTSRKVAAFSARISEDCL
jgi:hypothetical protein